MRKFVFLILVLQIVIFDVYGANIQGTVYDISFNELNNVIMIINTKPEQTLILKESNYSLNLPKGNYNIKAYYYENGILEAYKQEEIIISDDDSYTRDLVLFPSFEEEDILFNESEFIFEDDTRLDKKTPWMLLIITFLVLIVYFILKSEKKKRKKELQKELENKFDDIYLKNIFEIIKKKGGRITQKEIRKELKISEAKVSLVLTQLESEGKIKKIKKGRGNIVILISK